MYGDTSMKFKNLEDLERHAAHDTGAFMMYFLNKQPYACQEEWAQRLDDEELLWQADFEPRDHGKSELFTLSYPLRRICLNPDIRILIVKATKAMASRSISVIKTQLESNQRIKAFYAPLWLKTVGVDDISNADTSHNNEGQTTWGADKIYVKRNQVSQDPTIEGVGVGGAITGGHYDIIILDDVEDPARLKSDTAYSDQIDWYTGTILQLREPWTKTIVVGTFKRASGDLYELVCKNQLYSSTIQASIVSPSLDAITYERVFNKEDRLVTVKNILPKDIKVLCPEKWDIKRLIMDREGALTPGMTDNIWRREKMNDLSAFRESIFKVHWFANRYSQEETQDVHDGSRVKIFFKAIITGWDTAHTDKKTNSRSAFSVGSSIGIGDRGYYLLPEFYRAQVEYPVLKYNIARFYDTLRPNVVIIEYKDTGIALVQEMRAPVKYNGRIFTIPVIAYEPDVDKIARASASTTAWQDGLIYLPEDCQEDHRHDVCVNSWLPGWIQRHIDFPEATYKDDVDVMSMLVNYARRFYPLQGMKNDFKAIDNTLHEKSHSRVIDMRKTLGPAGLSVYAPKLASRVVQIPGRGSGRTLRQLPSGRSERHD